MDKAKNVFGDKLQLCSGKPLTGFYRDGCCNTGQEDVGLHVVCAQVTKEFLEFSKAQGNDLSTPHPELGFSGLNPGERWCLCVFRWIEAYEAGVAPPVFLASTHLAALEHVTLEQLKTFARDLH